MNKKLLVIPLVLVVAGLAWWGLTSTDAPLITASGLSSSPETQLLDSLSVLNNVELQADIFRDPTYATLQDFSTPIVPEPVGRENPFAPLNVTPASVAAPDVTTPASTPSSRRQGGKLFSNPRSQQQ